MIAVGELEIDVIDTKLARHDDAFGEVETMLRTLAADLGEVLRANELYTEQIEATARDLQAKLDTIERQQIAIADLSTPVLEIWTDILALPIVGVVDTQRSVEMTERLLQSIVDRGRSTAGPDQRNDRERISIAPRVLRPVPGP